MTLARICLLTSVFLKIALGADCSSVLPKQIILPSGWRAVTLEDLPTDDRELWQRHHRGKCPGIAVADTAGTGQKSCAIALLQNDADGKLQQQLMVWLRTGTGFAKTVLARPNPVVAGPFVVWTTPPGKSRAWDAGQPVDITHESFVYEKIEAVAWQFYLLNGTFHSLQSAN